jgi:hypothetical protein
MSFNMDMGRMRRFLKTHRYATYLQEAFREGKLPNGWELGLINGIPKTAGPAAVDKLRPIALQDIKKKCFMTIIMCMLDNVITHITHPQQVGCKKVGK